MDNIKIQTTNLKPSAFPANIYVVNNVSNYLSNYEKQHGWSFLFDGKSSTGWISAKGTAFPAEGWQIGNGTLMVLASEGKEAQNFPRKTRGGDDLSYVRHVF